MIIMILDKLLEKKDVLIYAKLRKEYLILEIQDIATNFDNPNLSRKKKKHYNRIIARHGGRIRELDLLIKTVNGGRVKHISRLMWSRLVKMRERHGYHYKPLSCKLRRR